MLSPFSLYVCFIYLYDYEQEIIYVWLSKEKVNMRLDILSSRNAFFAQEDIISQGTVCMMVTLREAPYTQSQ